MAELHINHTVSEKKAEKEQVSQQAYRMPNEACCSPEFSEGCVSEE